MFFDAFYFVMMIVLGGFAALLIIELIYTIFLEVYHSTLQYQTYFDIVQVVDKEYEEQHTSTTIMPVGKVIVPQSRYHDEEYNVHVIYEGKDYCINNKDLYERVNVGDKVCLKIHKGYNKKQEIKHIFITKD